MAGFLVMPPVWLLECEACVRVGTFLLGFLLGYWVILCLGGVLSFSHECGYPRGLVRCLWWGCVMLSGFFVL